MRAVSLFSVIKKSAPYCQEHQYNQALFYNVEQLQFLCQQCLQKYQYQNDQDQGQDSISLERLQSNNKKIKKNDNTNNSNNSNSKKTFKLQDIVQNPILLMVKQGSFLSKLNIDPSTSTTSTYKVEQFMRILTEMDTLIKTKKSTHQFTHEYFTNLKQQINNKINHILQKVNTNLQVIQQIQTSTKQLKQLKKNYSNQFLQTLQTNFVNGTQQELKQLLKKYSIENENPFRKIDEIVKDITDNISRFKQINWEHVMAMERKLLDGYMWREDKLYLLDRQLEKQHSLKEQNIILPYSAPYRLQFLKQQSYKEQKQQSYKEQKQQQTSRYKGYHNNKEKQTLQQQQQRQRQVYIKCTNNCIQLMGRKPKSINTNQYQYQGQDQNQGQVQREQEQQQYDFIQIDRYNCKHNTNIDTMYELPYKMLLSVSYQGLTFYSHQFNKIKYLNQIKSIKGCSQVLVFNQYLIVLATNNLYLINYHQLNKPIPIKVDTQQHTQVIEGIGYLYKERTKSQSQILLNIYNKGNNSNRKLKLTIN